MRPHNSITSRFTKDLTKPKKKNHYSRICKHCHISLVGRSDSLCALLRKQRCYSSNLVL